MVSLICPTLNEEKYIENILKFFVESLPKEKELIIVDGGSTDNTKSIVQRWIKNNKSIFLVHNSNKTVPFALNLGLKKAVGDIIIRLDAHTLYDPAYIVETLNTFNKTGADIVGGPMNPVGINVVQKSIAYCTSTIFGIGDSTFHFKNKEGWVDSVYLGSWKKEIFIDLIGFDEKFKRNQDDEFHYRAKSLGKKIYLSPKIKSYYYPRSSFKKLFSQYFQYGLYKPLVLNKIKSSIKLRHLIPCLFTLYLFALIFVFFIPNELIKFYLFPVVLYLILNFVFSFKCSDSLLVKICNLLTFPILHIAYGSGFIIGLYKLLTINQK